MVKNIVLNLNTSNPLLNKLMHLSAFSLTNFNINDLVTSIDLHSNNEVNDLAMSIYRKYQPYNWDQKVIDQMFEIYYEKLKTEIFKDSSSPVQADWTYGSKTKPTQFSVIQSKKKYENVILKDDIKSTTGNGNEQVTWKSSAIGDFTTSWTNWKNNPYYQSDDELLLKQTIHDNIDRDSIYFKTDTKYHY